MLSTIMNAIGVYNIDYFTGTIVLLGDAANDPNAKLKVNYDKHELVSFDKKVII